MKEEVIAKELANHLALMGLKRGDCEIAGDDFERSCRVAQWKIGPGAHVGIYAYFGDYFGAPHVWVGFGSSDAEKIALITRGINKNTFVSIRYADWNESLGLVNNRAMANLKQRGFTAYED